MPNAQNGWPVIPDNEEGRKKLKNLTLPGNMDHPVRVLAGDVAVIAQWHVGQYHRRVEPIKPVGCWGWNVRKIGDGPDWSNHAAACAWDLNAPDNPDGAPPSKVMTKKQIEECHKLEKESDGVLRWGGDWSDSDPMHWEIVGSRAQARKLAIRLKGDVIVERQPVMQEMVVKVPMIGEGDRDEEFTGYNMITRVQRIIGAEDDGWWGPLTTKRLALWCKISEKEAKVMTEAMYRNTLGLAR